MGHQNKDSKTIRTENLVVSGFLATTVLSGFLLTLPSVSADDVVDTITITVPSSCSMSSTIATGDEHTAEISNGQSNSEIGETTIKAFCNDNEGFAIYAIGYTDNELGKNVLTNSTLGSTHDIATGTNLDGANSSWAMKLSTIDGSNPQYPIIIAGSSEDSLKQSGDPDFSNFTNVPDDYKKVAYRTSSTDINPVGQQTAEGSTLKTTYQAYISPTQAAGEYTGQVKYTMLHPHTEPAPYTGEKTASGKICYYANASDSEGTMGCQTISDYAKDWSQCVNGTDYSSYCYNSGYSDIISSLPSTNNAPITLLASNFSREGYGFAGWSDAFDYATNTNANFYGPQETITIPDTSIYTGEGKGLSLYAVWVKSQGNLQDADKVASVCSELDTAPIDGTANLASVSALTDQRDSQTYAIAKLADDKCWMIENLRLADEVNESNKVALTTTNTNNPLNTDGTATIKNDDGNTTNHLSPTSSSWCTSNSSDCDGQSKLNTLNTNGYTSQTSSSYSSTGNVYSYGNYYNWYSATAGKGTYSKSSGSVDGDLCPKGWQLPIGAQSTADKSFGALSVALGGPTGGATANSSSTPTGTVMSGVFRSFPNNFLYSGYFLSSSAYSRGSYGDYWSSTAGNNYDSYYLYLYSSNVNPSTNGISKYYGFSIRCVSGS